MPQILPPYQVETPEYMPGMSVSVMPMTSKHADWLEDYEYYDQLGRDPLQQQRVWGINDPKERVEKLKGLLDEYPKQMHRRQILFKAACRGDEDIVRHLVDIGVRVQPDLTKAKEEEEKGEESDDEDKVSLPDKEDTSCVPLFAAISNGRLGCVKIFIESGVDVDTRDETGRTPLIAAACNSQVDIFKYLLARGADPTAKCYETDLAKELIGAYAGGYALDFAASRKNLEMVQILLDKNVEVTPLAVEVSGVSGYEVLRLLLDRGGYHPNSQEKDKLLTEEQKKTIKDATVAAVDCGDLKSMKLLLSYQYPLDESGDIARFEVPEDMHKQYVRGAYGAIIRNHIDMFEYIQSFGLEEHDSMSLDDLPPGQKINIQHLLDKAAQAGAVESVRYLIEKYGADPNKIRRPPGVTCLFFAAAHDRPDMVQHLLENYDIDIHLGNGRFAAGPTALWIAIVLKSFESVSSILQHGGPLDEIDDVIKNATGSLDAVLLAEGVGKGDAFRVLFKSEENVKDRLEQMRNNYEKPNSPYVRVTIGPEDKTWIKELQMRRSEEELRETGENARELNLAEAEKDLEPDDVRRLMPDIPTVKEREEELDEDDDLIPRFRPAFKAA